MSLEDDLKKNTAALEANTAATEALTAAMAGEFKSANADKGSAGAKGGRPPAKETAAAKKKREAAERKAAEGAAAAEVAEAAGAEEEDEEENEAELVAPRKSISIKALGKLLGDFMEVDDEDEAEEREEAVQAAFDHLGLEKLGAFEEPEDRVKMACYADNWVAGNTVVFEDIDEVVEGPAEKPKDGKKKKKSLLG